MIFLEKIDNAVIYLQVHVVYYVDSSFSIYLFLGILLDSSSAIYKREENSDTMIKKLTLIQFILLALCFDLNDHAPFRGELMILKLSFF